jgi:hypothetical protein
VGVAGTVVLGVELDFATSIPVMLVGRDRQGPRVSPTRAYLFAVTAA